MRATTKGLQALVLTGILWGAAAQADTPQVQVGALGTGGLAFGNFMRVTSGDTAEGTPLLSLAGAGLQGQLRVAEHLMLGVAGQWTAAGTERNSADVDGGPGTFRRHLIAANAEARWQFPKTAGTLPWASAGVGALLARDQWQSDGQDPGNAWQVAPALGLAVGADVPITAALAVGVEVRGHVGHFGGDPPKIPTLTFAGMAGGTVGATATRYQTVSLVTGSVVLRWRRP